MTNTYESIAFLTRDEAEEPIRILKQNGEASALEYLKQFHEPGEGTFVSTRENPWKDHDNIYEKDGWVMFYKLDVPYIGLVTKVVML